MMPEFSTLCVPNNLLSCPLHRLSRTFPHELYSLGRSPERQSSGIVLRTGNSLGSKSPHECDPERETGFLTISAMNGITVWRGFIIRVLWLHRERYLGA